MMLSLLRIVLSPLAGTSKIQSALVSRFGVNSDYLSSDIALSPIEVDGDWLIVNGPHKDSKEFISPTSPLYKNLFSWRLLTKTLRSQVSVPSAADSV
jgi:hypothetical protein